MDAHGTDPAECTTGPPMPVDAEIARWASLLEPTVDTDGDGRPDTATARAVDALVVGADVDADGDVDRVSVFAGDGEFGTWQYRRDPDGLEHWEIVDGGPSADASGPPGRELEQSHISTPS